METLKMLVLQNNYLEAPCSDDSPKNDLLWLASRLRVLFLIGLPLVVIKSFRLLLLFVPSSASVAVGPVVGRIYHHT